MRIFVVSMLTLLWVIASAASIQAQEISVSGNPHFDDYYTVNESLDLNKPPLVSLNPADVVKEVWNSTSDFQSLKERVYSLIDFDHHDEQYGNVIEPYNRKKHFGGWIVDHRDGGCLNTRGKILIRDSSVEVTLSNNGCTVISGHWTDPYEGRDYTEARDIQIDHFVPLKNAYISGADKWSPNKRCLYANFMGNNFHLLAVAGTENNRKSDKTPEGYMPPDKGYQCQYLAQWLKVKFIWSLELAPPEKEAVVEFIQANHCELSQMTFSEQELNEQRRFMADHIDLCEPGQ